MRKPTVTVVAEPPPKTFGLGVCPSCDRKTLLLTSTQGPRCRPCHPATPEEAD